jgi:tRNA-specific 2-thiouridylase
MLAALHPETVAHLRFPLGALTKPEVRQVAADHALSVAQTPDSQDLCFLAGVGKDRFLATHGNLETRPGDIVTENGDVIGHHRGHHRYTVGQRRGLGIAAQEPMYVLATDARSNIVTVGPRASLETTEVPLRDVVLHTDTERINHIRLRYRSAKLPGRLHNDTAFLDRPILGAAPGQAAVLLDGDTIVGHATIA